MGYVKLTQDLPEENEKPFAAFTGGAQSVICKKPKKLERLLNAVEPGCNVHYLSDGYFSLHDVVISLVKKHAPVDVYFTTYALRELPVRQLVMCKIDGLINGIHVVLDYKAQVRSAEVNAFAEMNFTKLSLKPIHAKVCVIQGDDIDITIIGSANWTTNPKTEAGVICENKDIAEFHKSWILKMINDEQIFK
jgi:hypothetical protein